MGAKLERLQFEICITANGVQGRDKANINNNNKPRWHSNCTAAHLDWTHNTIIEGVGALCGRDEIEMRRDLSISVWYCVGA